MLKKWVPLWTIPILILFSIGTVWLRLSIVRTAYSINQMDRETSHARQEVELLQVKVAELRSPRRLEALARTKFKLAQPRAEQVVRVEGEERPLEETSKDDI